MKEKIVNLNGIDYLVREDGKIFSTNRLNKDGTPKEIKQRLDKYGYYVITYGTENNRKCKTVHRIIGETFMPNDDENLEIDHIDNNKLNNNLSNLQWVTHHDNASKIPFERRSICRKGSKNGRAKLNEQMVSEIRRMYKNGVSKKQICSQYPCSFSNLDNIINYKSWK